MRVEGSNLFNANVLDIFFGRGFLGERAEF